MSLLENTVYENQDRNKPWNRLRRMYEDTVSRDENLEIKIVELPKALENPFDEGYFKKLGKAETMESILSQVMAAQVVDFLTVRSAATSESDNSEPPAWFKRLGNTIREEVTYDPEDGYPVADESSIRNAKYVVTALLNSFGNALPEPYFDVAPDSGVDIYFDHDENELMIHVPPPGSKNLYCFTRINGERLVHRHPTFRQFRQFLQQVIG